LSAGKAVDDAIREVLEGMAYLEVKTARAESGPPPADGILYVEVKCGIDDVEGFVGVFSNKRLAKQVAENYLGSKSVDPRLYVDLLSELTNVLAGRLLSALYAGRKPTHIDPPQAMKAGEAKGRWDSALDGIRLVMTDAEGSLGAVLARFVRSQP
jgi:CheY-specific phosphatase CheX